MQALADTIRRQFERQGFYKISFLTEPRLKRLSHQAGGAVSGGDFTARSAIVALFPYSSRKPPDSRNDFDSAPFAYFNYYREAVNRLRKALVVVRQSSGLTKKEFRIFCNSRLPERQLALAAEIGFQGKNSLLIVPGFGSQFIIAGVLLAFPLNDKFVRSSVDNHESQALCRSCQKCVLACPQQAIAAEGGVDSSRCLQGLATSWRLLTKATMQKWGRMIYGCHICQAVCPHNHAAEQHRQAIACQIQVERGPLLPLLTAGRLFAVDWRSDSSFRACFKNTVLDQGWIDRRAVLRNLIIATANSRCQKWVDYLLPYINDNEPIIRNTGLWALQRLRNGRQK